MRSRQGRPVVALESTIITHGMPYPENLATARAVEAVVRAEGATPATIAVIDGVLHAGLGPALLERLGDDKSVVKAPRAISRRPWSGGSRRAPRCPPPCESRSWPASPSSPPAAWAACTAARRRASTSRPISWNSAARRLRWSAPASSPSSISRRRWNSWRPSASRSSASGRTQFPAFYVRRSGETLDQRLDTPAEMARAIALHRALGSGTGLLIANPIPERDALDEAEMEARHRRGRGAGGAARHRGEGRHAVPAGADQRDHVGPKPHGQHRPRPQQRGRRLAHRRGLRGAERRLDARGHSARISSVFTARICPEKRS